MELFGGFIGGADDADDEIFSAKLNEWLHKDGQFTVLVIHGSSYLTIVVYRETDDNPPWKKIGGWKWMIIRDAGIEVKASSSKYPTAKMARNAAVDALAEMDEE